MDMGALLWRPERGGGVQRDSPCARLPPGSASLIRLRPIGARLAPGSRPQPLPHLLNGDVASTQDGADQLPVEPFAVGQQRRHGGGARGLEYNTELLMRLP